MSINFNTKSISEERTLHCLNCGEDTEHKLFSCDLEVWARDDGGFPINVDYHCTKCNKGFETRIFAKSFDLKVQPGD